MKKSARKYTFWRGLGKQRGKEDWIWTKQNQPNRWFCSLTSPHRAPAIVLTIASSSFSLPVGVLPLISHFLFLFIFFSFSILPSICRYTPFACHVNASSPPKFVHIHFFCKALSVFYWFYLKHFISFLTFIKLHILFNFWIDTRDFRLQYSYQAFEFLSACSHFSIFFVDIFVASNWSIFHETKEAQFQSAETSDVNQWACSIHFLIVWLKGMKRETNDLLPEAETSFIVIRLFRCSSKTRSNASVNWLGKNECPNQSHQQNNEAEAFRCCENEKLTSDVMYAGNLEMSQCCKLME